MARLAGYGGNIIVGTQVIEDCDDAWNEFVDADVTLTLDTTDYRVGTGSNKMVQAGALVVGDILASEVVSLPTMAALTVGYAWFKSSVNITTLDDYRILLDNHALCASPDCQLSVPILAAGVWKFCRLEVVAGSFAACTAVISVGLKLQANDPGHVTILVDQISAGAEVVGIREWSLDVAAGVEDSTSFSDGQAKVFTVTQTQWAGSFSGFKDGSPLEIGTVVGIELQESSAQSQMWRGSAIITRVGPAASVDGLVLYTYDFQGTHELEWPTT
tara:strand:- start:40 stop:858 length:819 start_codon:yes stop_codon:yes gene_type:complete